ncbi:iron-containing alcohol dehydrogenase [Chloroflexota bacterium]
METVGQWLRQAYAQGQNEEARYKMSMAAMLGGMSYGTESAGAVHAMSQTAGGVYNLPHGELTASLLAPVMAYNYMGEPVKYARTAQAMGENIWGLTVWEAAELAVDAVARLAEDLDIPTLPEMGIPEDDIPMLAQLAYDDPQTIGNPRDIDVAGYKMIYRSCFA